MIVLNVTYKCKPHKRKDFLETIKREGIDAYSRDEAGNIKYDYYISDAESDELLLVEKWEDAEAIAQHSAQAHFKKLGELKAEYVLDTIIEKFEK